MGGKRRQSGPRITLPTVAVLRVMLGDPTGDHYGLALAESTGFPSGTIYPVLARLEKAGWLASFWEDGDPVALERPRRRLYRLTGHGALAAREALDTATQRMFGSQPPAYQPRAGTA
ncbi:helix-turn-helix transcriptional regulator [Pseudofrankia sp. BMG5.37]|uniref:PadR family transcriptional regulator n=1 Tax=Pseudofrankia sp. BMG5.37 TaxID=3050035 RepID=UPI002893C6AE|nr:helix-turn-helix transcriptional regulator [Pseudofrankia sp. BMG5.37]MDT3447013.1 helix-turn-helix transcriptional regulator [Pseudofrankia sp. BMG5.37]